MLSKVVKNMAQVIIHQISKFQGDSLNPIGDVRGHTDTQTHRGITRFNNIDIQNKTTIT